MRKQLLCFVLLAGLLCSCAVPKQAERVSDEKLAQLRQENPYFTNVQNPLASYSQHNPALDTVDGCLERYATIGAPVVTFYIKDKWYSLHTDPADIYGDDKLNASMEEHAPWYMPLSCAVIDAQIEEVLFDPTGKLEKGDAVTLHFGMEDFAVGSGVLDIYTPGKRFMGAIFDFSDNLFDKDLLYRLDPQATYYLTDQDVIVSVSTILGMDAMSGLYLDTFSKMLDATLSELDKK